MAVCSSIATSSALAGKRPCTALKDSKRLGVSDATNAGAPPFVRRLPCTSRNVPGVKIEPAASATPGVARTWASICSVIGDVWARVSRPSDCVGVITTSWPRLAVLKMLAKDLLIVSVRM